MRAERLEMTILVGGVFDNEALVILKMEENEKG